MAEIVGLSPVWIQAQYLDNQGYPLAGGQLFTYQVGTDSNQDTYADSTGLVLNTNPIVLDSSGRLPTGLWLIAGNFYTFVLKDKFDQELSHVHDVSTPILTAGANITLDPVSGVGANITISAAGAGSGKANDHGQSYVFIGHNQGYANPSFNGSDYNGATFQSPTVSLTTPPDVEIAGNSLFQFNVNGTFVVEVTTDLHAIGGYEQWPYGESMFGSAFANALIQRSYHSRYSSGGGYSGLPMDLQQVSFTDQYVISAAAGQTAQLSIWAANTNNPYQGLDCTIQATITQIGPRLVLGG